MLEQNWGKEALKDFIKVKLYQDDPTRGKDYGAMQGLLFAKNPIPHYVVINPEGRITAHSTNIALFGVLPGVGAMQEEGRTLTTPEVFDRFLATASTTGYDFDLTTGFKAPAGTASAAPAPSATVAAK